MEARKALRITGWIVGGLAGALAIAYLALLAINRNDQAPSAAAVQLESLAENRPVLDDSRNAYLAMAELASGHAGRSAGRSDAVSAIVAACSEARACEEALAAHPGALAEWQDAEPELLQQYARILSAGGWQQPVVTDPLAPLPDFSAALEAQRLHLLTARQGAIAGDAGAVRDALDRDLAFWRGVMASSELLLTRMVAVAAVERHFQLGPLALRELPAPLVPDAVPASWNQPLTDAERSLMRPVAGEWRLVRAGLVSAIEPGATGAEPGWTARFRRPLVQPQATLNLLAGNLVALGSLSTRPYPELAEGVRALGDTEDQAGIELTIYNPIGSVLASSQATAAPVYADYIARGADLEGLRRTALLAATLRGQDVPPEAMPDALRAAALRNPYDDAPFAWDAAAGAVVFEGLAQEGRARHAVPL